MPLLVRGPGIPRGRVSRELVTNVDIAPTIAQIAGADPTRAVDGRSLLPFAEKPWPAQPPPDPAGGLPAGKDRTEEEGARCHPPARADPPELGR